MTNFYTFIKKYLNLPQEARDFIEAHADIIEGKRGEYYTTETEYKESWCFLLGGLVAGHTFNTAGLRTIHWIIEPGGYFTGSKHLFSNSSLEQNIEFFQDSRILQIPHENMRQAQEQFPEIGELIQIQKQHKINKQDILIEILKQPDAQAVYFKFMDEMGTVANLLTNQQVMDLLGLKRTTFIKVKGAYSRRR